MRFIMNGCFGECILVLVVTSHMWPAAYGYSSVSKGLYDAGEYGIRDLALPPASLLHTDPYAPLHPSPVTTTTIAPPAPLPSTSITISSQPFVVVSTDAANGSDVFLTTATVAAALPSTTETVTSVFALSHVKIAAAPTVESQADPLTGLGPTTIATTTAIPVIFTTTSTGTSDGRMFTTTFTSIAQRVVPTTITAIVPVPESTASSFTSDKAVPIPVIVGMVVGGVMLALFFTLLRHKFKTLLSRTGVLRRFHIGRRHRSFTPFDLEGNSVANPSLPSMASSVAKSVLTQSAFATSRPLHVLGGPPANGRLEYRRGELITAELSHVTPTLSLEAAAGTILLTVPDPARDEVRASQQQVLDKLARERQRETPSHADAPADAVSANPEPSRSAPASPTSTAEADTATVMSGDTTDLDLRSQVVLLRRRLLDQQAQINDMSLVAERLRLAEEQIERHAEATGLASLAPPAYDGQ